MISKKDVTRRLFLKGAAAGAGVIAASRGGLVKSAFAQAAEKPALLVVYFDGGYNALFPSADSFMAAGKFGVAGNNVTDLGNGLIVDSTFARFSAFAKQHMASIGVNHRISDHGAAQRGNVSQAGQSAVLMLASALGGDSSIKAAGLGDLLNDPRAPVGGVSLQQITDMKATITALGGGPADPTIPDREIGAKALFASNAMSLRSYGASPASLVTLKEGFLASIDTLKQPVKPFSFPELATAYGVQPTATNITNNNSAEAFTSKMIGAELMIRAGANVVTAKSNGWDSHGDRSGAAVRTKMNNEIMPGLTRFVERMVGGTAAIPGRNVVVVMLGDFSRSLDGSDHAANLTATVIGKYVKVGNTGKVNANVALPANTPGIPGLWGFLSAALKASPATIAGYGGNPHAALIG